ncbi:type II toxin-antitoxin system VapC family toxin [Paludisphaera soli]|uniref:type II toxin-antitoxin system VapC family toxin n=1 Tax=Paludisphaera soli TaxID=2712865 RepID=UPI0013EDB950|nr:type II toxin-antitoxin system VapC family toxin [Paludisphaera soli]
MSFLLDTNILSAYLRRPSSLGHRFVQHSGRLYTSSICVAELSVWALARPAADPLREALDDLLFREVGVLDFDADCASEFGRLRVELRRVGVGVDGMDLLIAATAMVYDLTLVTHNTAHFISIPGLRTEDWLVD